MRFTPKHFAATLIVSFTLVGSPMVTAQDWTQFRGNGGLSANPNASVPATFDDEKNVAWKTELPAKGASGPIVVEDKVIITCSGGPNQEQLYTVCLNAKTGKKLWTQKFWATGRTECHPLSANAAPTPATDGKHVFAFYSSNDLACMDLDGNLVWYRGLAVDYAKAGNDVGMSSSPVVYDGTVVVQVEGYGDAFVMALDAATGKTKWTKKRKAGASWASPLLLTAKNGPPLVVIQSQGKMSIFDLDSGDDVFEVEGAVGTVPSASVADGKLYAPVDGTTAYGISTDGKVEKVWTGSKIRPANASGVIHKDKLYTLNRAGVLTSYALADGEEVKKIRVGGSYWATPAVAGDNMYFFTQDGKARVVDLSDMEVVHEHDFGDEVFLGSPAVTNDALYFRSDKFIWKISGE